MSLKGYIKNGNTMMEVCASDSIAVGCIIPFAGNDNIPTGFLLCNGASISRGTYPDLFSVIGTTYGSVDGSHFNLPDLRDRFLEGSANSGTYIEAGLPNITGNVEEGYLTDNTWATGWYYQDGALYWEQATHINRNSDSGSSGYGKALKIDASRSSSIYGRSSTVQPKSLTVRYIIKAYRSGLDMEAEDIEITQVMNEINRVSASAGVIEQDYNYIRYANGLQMCWGDFEINVGSGANSNYYDGATFPLPFISVPIIQLTSNGGYGEYITAHCEMSTSTKIMGYYNITASSHNPTSKLGYFAIGRWK